MRDNFEKNITSGILLGAFVLALPGCGALVKTVGGGAGTGNTVTLKSGAADGTGDSALSNDSETSVTLTPPSGSAWSEFLVDLGAQFQKENICAGRTIFGRVGTAACSAFFDNRFNDVGSATKRTISKTGLDDDGYYRKRNFGGNYEYGTETIQKPDLTAKAACGETGTISERIADCDYVWNANGTASNVGHGSWSLVTKTTNGGYQVWRDDRTGLIWSDNMGYHNQCIASGNIENFDQAAARALWGDSAHVSGHWHAEMLYNCAPHNPVPASPNDDKDGSSLCAEADNLYTDPAYDEFKGGMRAPAVEWRLPTREDYFTAYANGMGFVLPNFLGTINWTASVLSGGRGLAWGFYASVYGVVYVADYDRDNTIQVRCVGR